MTFVNFFKIDTFEESWDKILWHFKSRFQVMEKVIESMLLSVCDYIKNLLFQIRCKLFILRTVYTVLNIVLEVNFDGV